MISLMNNNQCNRSLCICEIYYNSKTGRNITRLVSPARSDAMWHSVLFMQTFESPLQLQSGTPNDTIGFTLRVLWVCGKTKKQYRTPATPFVWGITINTTNHHAFLIYILQLKDRTQHYMIGLTCKIRCSVTLCNVYADYNCNNWYTINRLVWVMQLIQSEIMYCDALCLLQLLYETQTNTIALMGTYSLCKLQLNYGTHNDIIDLLRKSKCEVTSCILYAN